ncbi:MAG: gas vesicle protein GvpG [Deltaproteobacteria bacterium]|nr:gas vesicle protein GvpG [Deltaproteobacteria bacterium]
MAFLIDSFLLFIAESILEQAQTEFMNEEAVRRELRELYENLESGRIAEEEFEKKEEELVRRLEEIEEYKKEIEEAA